eukprot:scaffold880_cov132-Cylindrotheca_fusiformis.AAC.23
MGCLSKQLEANIEFRFERLEDLGFWGNCRRDAGTTTKAIERLSLFTPGYLSRDCKLAMSGSSFRCRQDAKDCSGYAGAKCVFDHRKFLSLPIFTALLVFTNLNLVDGAAITGDDGSKHLEHRISFSDNGENTA